MLPLEITPRQDAVAHKAPSMHCPSCPLHALSKQPARKALIKGLAVLAVIAVAAPALALGPAMLSQSSQLGSGTRLVVLMQPVVPKHVLMLSGAHVCPYESRH